MVLHGGGNNLAVGHGHKQSCIIEPLELFAAALGGMFLSSFGPHSWAGTGLAISILPGEHDTA